MLNHMLLRGLLPALVFAGGTVQAAENLFEEKFALGLGAYFMKSDTVVRADSILSARVGTVLDVEDMLGFDNEKLFRGEALWRFLPRHRLRLMYFRSDRTAQRVIDNEITFQDQVFPVHSDIRTRLSFDIIELAYEFRLLHGERYELGTSLGVHNVKLKLALDAEVSEPGSIAQTVSVRESIGADAPLPVVGLRGMYRLAPALYVQAHAQYFKLRIGGIDGDISDYQVGLLWQAGRHLGVGVSYNRFAIDADVNEPGDFQGTLKWKDRGPQLFLRASF